MIKAEMMNISFRALIRVFIFKKLQTAILCTLPSIIKQCLTSITAHTSQSPNEHSQALQPSLSGLAAWAAYLNQPKRIPQMGPPSKNVLPIRMTLGVSTVWLSTTQSSSPSGKWMGSGLFFCKTHLFFFSRLK